MRDEDRAADRIVPVTEEPAGDDACWLGQLCPECGAVPEGAGAQDATVPCWRCGAVREQGGGGAGGGQTAGVAKPPLDSSS
ncbi:hypothetical protein [Brachybacterium sp. sponge]|uniref:hypothetical protein n=1 Tax=Brachybacterium sp. sponge TaxID=1775432 RepID=UPI0007A3FDE4|nr:hypothetical protein [Brachybacterium sp. sponge]